MNQKEIAIDEFQRQLRMLDIFRPYTYEQNFFYDDEEHKYYVRAYSFVSGLIDGITCMVTDQDEADKLRDAMAEYLNDLIEAHNKYANT